MISKAFKFSAYFFTIWFFTSVVVSMLTGYLTVQIFNISGLYVLKKFGIAVVFLSIYFTYLDIRDEKKEH